MDNALNKSSMLEAIKAERALWEELLEEVGLERMTESRATDRWSAKDVVAHVTYWQERLSARLEHSLADPNWKPQGDARSDDEINDEVYMENLPKSAAQVLLEAGASYHRLVAALEALPGEDLSRMHPNPYADDASWPSKYPLWQQITGNSLEHLQEHRESIRAWLDAHETHVATE